MGKQRWLFDKSELIKSLSRAEGQVRSIKSLLEESHDPTEVMQQLKAARQAIDQVGKKVMFEYIKSNLKGAKDPVAQFEKYEELVKKYGW